MPPVSTHKAATVRVTEGFAFGDGARSDAGSVALVAYFMPGNGRTQATYSFGQLTSQRPRTHRCGVPLALSLGLLQRAQALQVPPINTSLSTTTPIGLGVSVILARSSAVGSIESTVEPSSQVGAASLRALTAGAREASLASSAVEHQLTLDSLQAFGVHLLEPPFSFGMAGHQDHPVNASWSNEPRAS